MIMDFGIRKMQLEDKKEILAMMEEFYSSNAVATNGSNEIFETDFENCINGSFYFNQYCNHRCYPDAGRKAGRTWSNQRFFRYILEQEQRSFP